jgi:pimeloyl-ACP methyl ester carboxylesterase
VAKPSKPSAPPTTVRTRRAYFDCTFGQLHVRTAFPTTGGFDEQSPLFCLHAREGSSRTFARFLPEIADVRSVYAPDLPGHGESDPSPGGEVGEAAAAVADLAGDLRLRQIDLLGFRYGAAVACELAARRPELVRRVVLVGLPAEPRAPAVKQATLVLRIKSPAESTATGEASLPDARGVDLLEYTDDLFETAAGTLAQQIGAFLAGRAAR